MLALCDSNNFFVSCERLYRPELRGRPVVVLSSNDGCIISRSNEAKAMGITMGAPYFQIRGFLRQKGVAVCSGNLAAYKEISDRVTAVLAHCTDACEIYSIDEAFLNIPKIADDDPARYAANVRRIVDRVVGIPVSIGVAPSKTLAKLASERAKKTDAGVLYITEGNRQEILSDTPLGDVWGIGPKAADKLTRRGLFTADDFTKMNPVHVRKLLSIRGVMTQLELAGQPCFPLVTSSALPQVDTGIAHMGRGARIRGRCRQRDHRQRGQGGASAAEGQARGRRYGAVSEIRVSALRRVRVSDRRRVFQRAYPERHRAYKRRKDNAWEHLQAGSQIHAGRRHPLPFLRFGLPAKKPVRRQRRAREIRGVIPYHRRHQRAFRRANRLPRDARRERQKMEAAKEISRVRPSERRVKTGRGETSRSRPV